MIILDLRNTKKVLFFLIKALFIICFSGVMRCSAGKDTGCGDVDDVTGNSAMTCANNVCTFTCPADKFHYGVTAATCTIVNGMFENENNNFQKKTQTDQQ